MQEDVAEQFDAVEFVYAEDAFDVERSRNLGEGKRGKIRPNQRDIRRDARQPLVDVLERLQIGELDHREEGLLEWVIDVAQPGEDPIEALLHPLRHGQGLEAGTFDSDDGRAQPPGRARIRAAGHVTAGSGGCRRCGG